MLLEYVPGGELFTYLRTAHRFDNHSSLFFASEIVMALDYLHSQNIVYRYIELLLWYASVVPQKLILNTVWGLCMVKNGGHTHFTYDNMVAQYSIELLWGA